MSNEKNIITKQLLFLTIFVFVAILTFTIWNDSAYFLYLLWNIFLAFLPFVISFNLLRFKNDSNKYKIIFIFSMFFWLILFPNAPYLITDLIHIGANSTIPIYLDIVLLFSCAYIGILITLDSIFHIEKILFTWYGAQKTNLIILISIFLSSFGIYLGRFLRWNSWDVFFNPKFIFNDILNIFYNPLSNIEAYITTASFFIFISALYFLWRNFKNSLNTN